MTVTTVISTISCLLGLGITARHMGGLRGTTLVQPACWLIVFYVAASASQPFSSATVHFLASSVSFCPLISLLGARRPHQTAFNLVVITLWIVITSPAWEAILLSRSSELQLGGVRTILLVMLVAGTPCCYAFTRNALAGLLAGLGQLVLFAPYLWGTESKDLNWLGIPCITVALLIVVLRSRTALRPDVLNAAWQEYRDRFGTLWGLRLLERLRGISRSRNWDLHLTFSELANEADWTKDQRHVIAQEMRNVMRRFMAQLWIEQRLTDTSNSRIEAGQ